MTYVTWLHRVNPAEREQAGLAVTNLLDLQRAGIPMLPAFVILPAATRAIFLQKKLRQVIEGAMREHAPKKASLFAGIAKDIQKAVKATILPADLKQELSFHLDGLEEQVMHRPGSEMRIELSIAGTEHHHYAACTTFADFQKALLELLLPAFSKEDLFRRVEGGESVIPTFGSIVVRFAKTTEASGTIQNYDPERHDGETLYIVAHQHHRHQHGLHGDVYRFDRKSILPLSSHAKTARFRVTHDGKHHKPSTRHEGTVLNEEQQLRLARLGKTASELFPDSQRFTWVLSDNHFFFTGVEAVSNPADPAMFVSETMPIALGHGLNLGLVTGIARVITSKGDQKLLTTGEIAVLSAAGPKDYEWLLNGAGFVAEHGYGATVEASLAMRLGIPAVGSVNLARTLIKTGQLITVDGTNGAVYAGRHVSTEMQPAEAGMPITATKTLLILDDPLHADAMLLSGSDGIGLLRGEFLLNLIGVHPSDLTRKGMLEEYTELLEEHLERLAHISYPHPLTYQLHDIRPESLIGRLHAHRHEPNPKLGYRGTHRILHEPDLLEVELQVLANLVARGLTNLRILFPVVRKQEEITRMHQLITSMWPTHETLPEIWVRCATPALAITAEHLADHPIQGVYFDIPMLAELIAGFDGDNYQVAHHVQQDEAALGETLHYAISACRAHGIQSGLLAEGEELHANIIDTAVRAGVLEVVVTPSEVPEMRNLLGSVEQRIILEYARLQHEE